MSVSPDLCPICGGDAHQGDSEESLATLDPEAAVFYDRDIVEIDRVRGDLCGPRFRMSKAIGLHAHFGSPSGERYVVFKWGPATQAWTLLIDRKHPLRLRRP